MEVTKSIILPPKVRVTNLCLQYWDDNSNVSYRTKTLHSWWLLATSLAAKGQPSGHADPSRWVGQGMYWVGSLLVEFDASVGYCSENVKSIGHMKLEQQNNLVFTKWPLYWKRNTLIMPTGSSESQTMSVSICQKHSGNFVIAWQGEQREVHHFHFLSWIDKSRPEQAFPLLAFLRLVRSFDSKGDGPLVVHCR